MIAPPLIYATNRRRGAHGAPMDVEGGLQTALVVTSASEQPGDHHSDEPQGESDSESLADFAGHDVDEHVHGDEHDDAGEETRAGAEWKIRIGVGHNKIMAAHDARFRRGGPSGPPFV